MKHLLLTYLFLVACNPGEPIKGYDSRYYCGMQEGCTEWTADIISAIFDDYTLRWETLFDETPEMPREVYIEDHFWYMFDIPFPDGGVYEGHANGTTVWVRGWRLDEATGNEILLQPEEAVLPHECIHNSLRAKYGDGDANHEEPGGPWNSDHTLITQTMMYRDVMEHYDCDICQM